jgi:hypothetical protein
MSTFFMGVVAPGMITVPVVAAACKISYREPAARCLTVYLLLGALFNIAARLTAHTNNLPLLHLYTALEFVVLCLFFGRLFRSRRANYVLILVAAAFVCTAIVYALRKSIYVYNAGPRFLSSILLTGLCIWFLACDLNKDLSGNSASSFSFIAVVGLLLYFSSCATLFGLSNYLMLRNHDMQIDTFIWNMHAACMVLMYLVFARAFLALKPS